MEFRRKPRLYSPIDPLYIRIEDMPQTPIKKKRSLFTKMLYPFIMVAAYGAMFAFGQGSISMLIFPLIMIVPMVLVPLLDEQQSWNETMAEYKNEIIEYNSYLDGIEQQLEIYQNQIRNYNLLEYPSTEVIIDRCTNLDETLWSKRAEYDDFTTICLGYYNASPITIDIDIEKKNKCKNNDLVERVEKIMKKNEIVVNYPLLLKLSENSCLGIECDSSISSIAPYVSAIMQNIAYSSGYDELKIMAILDSHSNNDYDWIRWLPHCWDENKKIRFFAKTNSDKEKLLNQLEFICESRVKSNGKKLPYIVVLVDDIDTFEKHSVRKYFRERNNQLGISLVFVSDFIKNTQFYKGLPSQATNVLQISEKGSVFSAFGKGRTDFFAQKIGKAEIERLARYLASISLTDDNNASALPSLVTLYDLYGEKNLSNIQINSNWKNNKCYIDGIRSNIGLCTPTEEMELDLSDEKDGAHMLVAGTTGSGKSEFLQTLVLSIALRYNPNEVSFVFIDFKEGGMSESFKNLPHNAGSLTNISEELEYFANRAMELLNLERKRRAKILESYGQKINLYHKAYHESGKSLEPLPHLFIVIDEFAEVINQCPEFKEMMISLSRVGRSLGIHLVLATQSPSQSVDSQIWSNSNCKICLKVLNDEESNAVLKTKIASSIQTRGRAFCLSGTRNGLVEFQTAWCGAPTTSELFDNKVEVLNDFNTRSILTSESKNNYSDSTQLSVMMSNMIELFKNSNIESPHLVLDSCLPTEYVLDEGHSEHNSEFYVGLGDFIKEYKKKPISINFASKNNHMVIYGPPKSGKSNIIRQMVNQLSLNCTTDDVQVVILQYGSKSLADLENNPIVSEYVTNLVRDVSVSEEKMMRLIPFVYNLIQQRQDENNNSIKPQVIIVIDGWEQMISVFDNLNGELLNAMAMNPSGYGIHFVITTGTGSIGYKLSPHFDTNIALKYDRKEFGVDEFSYEKLVLNNVGRGVFFDNQLSELEFQTISECRINSSIDNNRNSSELIVIPTMARYLDSVGIVSRQVYKESNGESIVIGVSNSNLEWKTISFDYRTTVITCLDDLKKYKIGNYIGSRFSKFNIMVFVEEGKKHYYDNSWNLICSTDENELLKTVESINERTVILMDNPNLLANQIVDNDYNNPVMFPWQETLREKINSGLVYLVWLGHPLKFGGYSATLFSDFIQSFSKRIAIGGKGDNHPFFNEKFDIEYVYLDNTSAFVSYENSEYGIVNIIALL